jgi:hypothetical protein
MRRTIAPPLHGLTTGFLTVAVAGRICRWKGAVAMSSVRPSAETIAAIRDIVSRQHRPFNGEAKVLLDEIDALEAGQRQQLLLHKAECAGLESEVSRLASLKQKLVDANYDLNQELAAYRSALSRIMAYVASEPAMPATIVRNILKEAGVEQ